MKNTNNSIRRLTVMGMFTAIIIVMTVVPYLGYISYSPLSLSITTLHIPVILGAFFLGVKGGAVLGGVWGLTCLIKAFVEPIEANIPFQNPLVSVLPRIAVGVVAALLFVLLSKLMPKLAALTVSAIISTLFNTLTVITMLYFFNYFDGLSETVAAIFSTVLQIIVGVNGIVELVAAAIIVPLLYLVCDKNLTVKF